MDNVVDNTKAEIVEEQRAYNPAVTMGHDIRVDADYDTQMKEARLEAARTAAALPRGGNFGIGSLGDVQVATASQGLAEDPMTAVRIAHYHGWDGARSGIPAGGVPAGAVAAPAAVAAGAAVATEIELVPGRDYQVIEITDGMPPEEIRKARTANAKARSAAMKAAKTAQQGMAPAAAAPVAAAAGVAVSAPVGVSIEPPVLIEITDGMAPEDVRKARVANAKAQSAYNKALKAAGGTPGMATAAVAETAAPVVGATPTPVAPVGIEPPQLIVITDDMAPEDIRKARVANAKAQSAYNKALKAAGIDPSAVAVEAGQGGVSAAASNAAPAVAASAAAAAAVAIASEPSQADIEASRTAELAALPPEDAAKFNATIATVEGVAAETAEKLTMAGVNTPFDLLKLGATPKGRAQIAAASGLSAAQVLTMINHSDLYRIQGVGERYAVLLEKAGVDTVVELATRNPGNLTDKLTEVNAAEGLVEQLPSLTQVDAWVSEAKGLPRAVFYDNKAPAAASVSAASAAPAAAAAGPTPESLGIPRPVLVEITESMSPEEIRAARVGNAKASAAFSKALKAAGIDPSTVQ